MQTEPYQNKSSCHIHMRVNQEVRDRIDTAAQIRGKTRTAFILECAEQLAEEILRDQDKFTLEEEKWEAFAKALDAAPSSNKKLQMLLQSKSPWE